MKKFNSRLFLLLFSGFIAFTIIGTLSHELGHYVVAKYLGHQATIHYGMVHSYDPETEDYLDSTREKYREQIKSGLDFPGKERYFDIRDKSNWFHFRITLGGPVQTMLTGTIGLILLFVYRKRYRQAQKLSGGQWLLIFITLFWLRQTANLVVWAVTSLYQGRIFLHGDEVFLAWMRELPLWSIITATGVTGAMVLAVVVFWFIPKPQRVTFILAGATGGVCGYMLWLKFLGPVVMP